MFECLYGIDAPEKGQDYGNAAKKALSDLVFGKQVRLMFSGTDRYGRKIVSVKVGDIYVNQWMIRHGFAWHYKKYDSSKVLATAEKDARAAKVGLWSQGAAIPPWEYRSGKKSGNAEVKPAPAGEGTYWINTSSSSRHTVVGLSRCSMRCSWVVAVCRPARR